MGFVNFLTKHLKTVRDWKYYVKMQKIKDFLTIKFNK